MPNIDASPILLRSDRLLVEIAAPGTVYRRTRFDWTGFVTQVTLDGRHTFCAVEDLNPRQGSGGVGLCGEFGIDQPVGYAEAKPGELFPKLGVGLLERANDGPYDFFYDYTIAERFPMRVEADENTARFTVEPVDCSGYAARVTKTLRVDNNTLRVDYRLKNVGRRAIVTNEYYHNFCAIDGQAVGPDYRLAFPYTLELEPLNPDQRDSLPALLNVRGDTARWNAVPEKQFYFRPVKFVRTSAAQWELVQEASGAGMREYDDFAPLRVAVWGRAHVVSVEMFVEINVQPGESQEWQRRYEFFA